ncbi:DUF2214 family protein [Caldimonas sp. KR1-144]|uniref:DUF2214 family protein n=1 Tax=Caldimonas sp. KR1-144 TaxID=3400911 RepID=UPI003C00E7CA
MTLEALLAYAHIVAILSLVTFLASEAALCRPEWLNTDAVRRLSRLDLYYLLAAMAVLLTGVARAVWGMKGLAWYGSQPLLWGKVVLYATIGLCSLPPTRAFRRWQRLVDTAGALPPADEVRAARRWVMLQAHLVIGPPLLAVMLARGLLTR